MEQRHGVGYAADMRQTLRISTVRFDAEDHDACETLV